MVQQWSLFTRTNAARNENSFSHLGVIPAKGVIEFSKRLGRKPIQVHISFELPVCTEAPRGSSKRTRRNSDNSLIPCPNFSWVTV